MNLNIAVLAGDGIGPEIVAQALRVTDAVAKKFGHELHTTEGLVGAVAIDETGNPYPEETHNSELVKATQDGLNFVFENWKPAKSDTTVELVVKFYQKRSEQNGFQELPPEQIINDMGYEFLNAPNKLDEAIKFFELNTKNYPTSFNVFDSLGDGYSVK